MLNCTQNRIDQGVYVVVLRVLSSFQIKKKNFNWDLKAGIYTYFGSALGKTSTSLSHRLFRHFKSTKRIFWHIDLLTTNKNVEKLQAYYTTQNSDLECELLQQFIQNYSNTHVIRNFGSSDCRSKCRGHLLYLSNNQEELLHLNDYFLQRGWSIYNYTNESISD
ncbi:MAG: DUF123 domain-containing protein [Candidatus Hodarchaeota archaeon]